MKRKFTVVILTLVTVFLMIPVFTVPASAETVTVNTADELRAALQKDGDVSIVLTADITKYKLPNDFKWDGYDEDTDFFYWVTVGKGKKSLDLQGHEVAIDDDFITTAKYKIEKQYNAETGKTEENKAFVKGLYIQNAAMMRIPTGADLTIYGSGGGFTMTAQMPAHDQIYDNHVVMQRDVFVVRGGTLTVQGGSYQAGRRKDIYVSVAWCYTEHWGWETVPGDLTGENIKPYTGYGEYAINGRALRIYDGKAFINGGTFKGHGFGYTKKNNTFGYFGYEDTSFMTVFRNSVISAYGGELSIRDINVIGYCGADALYKRDTAKVDVYSGEFSTTAPGRFLWPNTSTSSVFVYAGIFSYYKAVDVKPGGTSLEGTEMHDKASTTKYDNKTVVFPAPSGFVGGRLSWSDGTSDEAQYTIGSKMAVKFDEPDTYFPRNTIEGGQSCKYYWSLMVQRSDGKWTTVGSSWTEGGKTIDLATFNDNWAEGRNYRLNVKRVESWTSDVHSYEQTMKATNTLYFTVKNDKVINSVTVDGFSGSLASVGPNTLTSKTQGVKSVSSVWYENGNAHTDTIAVKNGSYQANITLVASDGYVFSSDTKVSTYGTSVTPSFISSDGKLIQALSPVINKACDHSGSTSDWTSDTVYHYKYCSICGKTEQVEKHKYGSGVSSGNLTTYTCTVCGYEKTVQNGKEAISAVLLDMPALIVGGNLSSPKVADDFADKTSIVSYQWYKGRGTSTKVSAGTKAESGWYTLEVSLNVKSGYYFKTNAFVTHSHGTKAGASATDTALTGTVNVYCSEEANLNVVIPRLSPDKTLGDVIKDIKASRSGDERINVNYYVTVGGQKYSVKRSFDGKYTLGAGASTLEQLFGKKIVPDMEYEIEIEASTGSYYVDPENVSVDSRSFLIGYTSESNDTWASAKATVLSDTDVIGLVEIYGVETPVTGAEPNKDLNLYDSERIKVTDAFWSISSAFACDTAYTFTAKVKAVNGFRFDGKTAAVINGAEAKISVNGSSAEVSFTFPKTGHKYGEWITEEPTCEDPGHSKRTCSVCGGIESNEIPPEGHDFYFVEELPSTCATEGISGHYLCRACTMCFDADKKEKTEDAMRLPLNKSNHEGGNLQCDGESHYILCACGEKLDVGAHTFKEWTVEKEAEPGLAGLKSRECTECGYLETEEIAALPGEHVHSFTVKYDETNHWNQCACGEITDKEAHSFDEQGVCTVCGFDKSGNTGDPSDKTGETDPETGSNSLPVILIVAGSLILIAAAVCITVLAVKLKKAKKNSNTPEIK